MSAFWRLPTCLAAAVLAGGCGGDSPAQPTPPDRPPSVPTHTVVAVVFYDQNGDGRLDSGENVRVPGVELVVGGRSGRSEKLTGRATITEVPAGTHTVSVRGRPPFYAPVAATLTTSVPQAAGTDLLVPVTLDIGSNRPNVYMAFGDSITVGQGSAHVDGYKSLLRESLQAHLGRAEVIDQGSSGTRSDRGAERIGVSLNQVRPAYTLILYGTNDWNRSECKTDFPCFTIDSLRSIVGAVKSTRSLPLLGTIPPANPEVGAGVERNQWVARMNDLIRPMAVSEGAVLVDVHAGFLRAPKLSDLFTDHVHPNDAGYRVIAEEFFKAVTQTVAGSTAAFRPGRWRFAPAAPGAWIGPGGPDGDGRRLPL